MYKFLLFAFLVLVATFVAVGDVSACTCARPVTKVTEKALVEEARSDATMVFVGRVVKIVKTRDRQGKRLEGYYSAIFEVTEQWKGETRGRVLVSFYSGCCMCDFHFVKGKEYLVYASQDSEMLTASTCGRTKETSNIDIETDRKYLGFPATTSLKR